MSDKLATRIKVDAFVLSYDNRTEQGNVVFNYGGSHFKEQTYKRPFGKKDLFKTYKQPQEGDRVEITIICGYDSQIWYVEDRPLKLVCRATPTPMANDT